MEDTPFLEKFLKELMLSKHSRKLDLEEELQVEKLLLLTQVKLLVEVKKKIQSNKKKLMDLFTMKPKPVKDQSAQKELKLPLITTVLSLTEKFSILP